MKTRHRLLRAVRAALVPGGPVVTRVSGAASGAGSVDLALNDLHLLLSTDAGGAQGSADIAAWIADAGFPLLPPFALPGHVSGHLLLGLVPD